ncbi:WD40/YVTN/BNR-like repeat-containing protein [Haloferax namakaokahaiae]|uniref:WD40/YVTN/BNR-like repeat-containing protein n=1 Tax=Haloferax namakaokahaiae TaxID=1748331 RepID=A0ABD5ZHH9_9EURY
MQLYAAVDGALLVVSDPRGDPSVVHHFDAERIECVAADARRPSRAFCGTFDSGLYRTTDAGETWDAVGERMFFESMTSLAISPADPDTIYAGTEPSAVYRSTDGGETWRALSPLTSLPSSSSWAFPPRPTTHHARWIEVDPADPEHLFVAVEAGALVQSFDGGETWEDRVPTSRRDTHSMATHPDAPGHVCAAAGDGYAESEDGGETWSYPTDGLEHGYCWNVAVDSDDPESRLLTAARSAMHAHSPRSAESYLYRRRSGGPWVRLSGNGLPTGKGVTRSVLRASDVGGECFAANDHGVYRTTNFGDTWSKLDLPWRTPPHTAAGLALG